MRLLFDQSLSPSLKHALRDLYPESLHVIDVRLDPADDFAIWTFAQNRGLLIASNDSGFRQLSSDHGTPPRVICIRRGNCSTSEIAAIFRDRYAEVSAYQEDPQGTFLALT